MKELQFDFSIQYDEKDSIGKRYRRQDAIGTPYAITIDHQSLEDNTVTIRDRDTMEQERVDLSTIRNFLLEKTGWNSLLLNQ
jgi:glycyl-tRNA synthetase